MSKDNEENNEENYILKLYRMIGNTFIDLKDYECAFEKYYPIGEETQYKPAFGEVVDLTDIDNPLVPASMSKDEYIEYILDQMMFVMFYLFVYAAGEEEGYMEQMKEISKMYMILNARRTEDHARVYEYLYDTFDEEELKAILFITMNQFENLC